MDLRSQSRPVEAIAVLVFTSKHLLPGETTEKLFVLVWLLFIFFNRVTFSKFATNAQQVVDASNTFL